MSVAMRMSQTSDSMRPFITFDLSIEGLTHFQARNLSQSVNDLVLGPATDQDGNRPITNPLAIMDADGQKYVAIICKVYSDRFSNKISCIRMLRSLFSGLGLKDGKDFVDYALSCTIASDRNLSSDYTVEPQPWIKF